MLDLNQAFFDSSCLLTASCTTIDISNLTQSQLQLIQYNPYLYDSLLIGRGGRRTISKVTPTVALNSVDNPVTPVTGRRLTFSSAVAGLGGDTRYVKPSGEAVWFLQQNRKISLGLRAQAEYIRPYGSTVGSTNSLPIFEKLVLGGGYSVRGYDLRSIGPKDNASGVVLGGNKSLLFNAEYLISIAGPVRLVLFYDAGQVRDNGDRFGWKEPVEQLTTINGLTPLDQITALYDFDELPVQHERFQDVDGRRDPLLHAGVERAVPVDFRGQSAAKRRAEFEHAPAGEEIPLPLRRRFYILTRGQFLMTRRFTIAACSSVLFLSAQAFAQQPPAVAAAPAPPPLRMAFVDLQRVAAESTEGKAANAKVSALTQTKSGDITAKQKQLEGDQQKLQQGGAVLNDATRGQLQKEVDRLTVEIDRAQQDAQAEVQELQQQQLAAFQDKLRPVVEALVKELGVGLLFSAGDAGAIYIDPSLDITAEVIKRFDAASTSKPAAAAPAPTAKPPAAAPAGRGTPPPAATPPATPPAGRGITPGRGTAPARR